MSSTGFPAQLVAAFSCFVLGLALTYGAIKGGRRLWLRLHHVFGPDGLRAVSFFVAALPFLLFLIPEFQKLLILALKLILVPFGFLLRSTASPSTAQASAEAGSFGAHLSEAFASIARSYSEVLGQYAWNNHQPLLKGAAFLLLWVGIGQLLRLIISQPGEKALPLKGTDGRSNFEAFAKKLRSWQPSSALCLLLLFGLYLSLASIVGIARLNGKPAGNGPDISPKQLRKELEGLQLTQEKLANAYPKDVLQAVPLQVQILLDLDKAVTAQSGARDLQNSAPHSTPAPEQEGATPPSPSEASRQLAQIVRRSREELQSLWSQMLRVVITEQRRTLDSAYTLFEVDSYPMPGYRERADHFIAIRSWYEGRSGQLEGALDDCKGAIHTADQLLNTWAEELVRSQNVDSALPRYFASAFETASAQCKVSPLVQGVPTRVVSHSRLVVIFFPVSWILESESESLALIVGMIGFGLLGSVVSSFIRSQKTALRENHSLKFSDLLGVVLRGVSAAVVVFLGVQSGLSIFGGSQEHPHLSPYVVLLACLVAAVFSEDAWAIARRRFRSYVGEDRAPGQQPPPEDAKEQA